MLVELTKCAVCSLAFDVGDYTSLSLHFWELAGRSDSGHVMWLNKNITKQKTDAKTLSELLRRYFDIENVGLKQWIRKRFIERFYGANPHPFVIALQHPSRATLLGYVVEHQHFLHQWTRSCAYIIAKTDKDDVTLYELDNINTEFGGYGPEKPSHYELLLRMGESLGFPRSKLSLIPPLPATASAIRTWNGIAEKEHWLETMAAMHPLELIADRNLMKDGATVHYFDPSILDGKEITEEAKSFLREGYEADVEHSENALNLIQKYSPQFHKVEEVQASFLRSVQAFDEYLMARLQRSKEFEST